MTTAGARLTPAELRTLFLFSDLDDDQLHWVATQGDVIEYPAGSVVAAEGEPGERFFVLLSGEMTMVRLVGGSEVELARTARPGVYCGAVQFYVGDRIGEVYPATSRAVTDCRFLALASDRFAEAFRRWYPMAGHLLEGLFVGLRSDDQLVGQRERLLALGKLTAGLTHELNNPAAAASRATFALRERQEAMRQDLALLAGRGIDGANLRSLTGFQEEFVARSGPLRPALATLARSDLEDELAEWLDAHGVSRGWELAGVFVSAGVGAGDLDRVVAIVDEPFLEPAVRWLAHSVETETLLAEILDSTARISGLLDSARQYSQLDRAAHQVTDLHAGLDATLVMMSAKIGPEITIVKDYDTALPPVPAYPGELNQVWTNLVHNALDAMAGEGRLTLRTAVDGESALVEVVDTGPGIPALLRRRIFEPFFTTKPVGRGTGLGLDISWRIVVNRHGGDLRVLSRPGETRFQVRLPLREAEDAPPASTGRTDRDAVHERGGPPS